jgi:hypothetical protein
MTPHIGRVNGRVKNNGGGGNPGVLKLFHRGSFMPFGATI